MQKFRPAMPVRTVVLGATVVTSLALAGCSGGSSGATGGKADGPLVFGISADPTQTVPWLSTSTQSIQVLGQIYSTLLNTDANLQPVAGLADLPKISDDGLTYTFTLKKDLKFGNGSALDSEDVKYTFDTIMDPATKATSASYFASVKGIEAPDPQTVVVTLKAPDASFVSALSNVNTSIVPSDVPVDSLTTKPVGSGPYLFESRTPNQSITLKANPGYYQGKPGLTGVQFRIIADEKAMVSALRSGAVDMAVFDNSVTEDGHRRQRQGLHRRPAELPRPAAAGRCAGAEGRQRAPGHRLRDRPQAGARHGRPRRGQGHRPGDVAGIPL
jgi:peptide/nickel transport system substrate-binding protein